MLDSNIYVRAYWNELNYHQNITFLYSGSLQITTKLPDWTPPPEKKITYMLEIIISNRPITAMTLSQLIFLAIQAQSETTIWFGKLYFFFKIISWKILHERYILIEILFTIKYSLNDLVEPSGYVKKYWGQYFITYRGNIVLPVTCGPRTYCAGTWYPWCPT